MFTDMLDELMKKKGVNKSTLSKESGIPYTTIDGWYKKGNEDIRLSTLRKLCAYFDVSLDYIMEEGVNKKEKAPANRQEPVISMEASDRLLDGLIHAGLISDGEDLSDDDLAFLTHIVELLDTWFSRKR